MGMVTANRPPSGFADWRLVCGVEVHGLASVVPSEAVALPHFRSAFAAGVLERTALEAVVVALGVCFRRGGLAEQPAKVDEALLRCGALLQLRCVLLRNELVRRHQVVKCLLGRL